MRPIVISFPWRGNTSDMKRVLVAVLLYQSRSGSRLRALPSTALYWYPCPLFSKYEPSKRKISQQQQNSSHRSKPRLTTVFMNAQCIYENRSYALVVHSDDLSLLRKDIYARIVPHLWQFERFDKGSYTLHPGWTLLKVSKLKIFH